MVYQLLLSFFVGLIPWQPLKQLLYKLFWDYKFGKNVKIGLSLIACKKAYFGDDSTIDHFNLIVGVNNLVLKNGATIKKLNWIKDIDEFLLDSFSSICRHNRFTRSAHLTQHGDFYLGQFAVVTVGHLFDLIDDIKIGSKTTIAGIGSQFWTHGFDNFNNRIQGPIIIGESCYIGSRCLINLGIKITDYTQIGMGSVVTKSINESQYLWAGNPALKRKKIDSISNRSDVCLSMKYKDLYSFYRKLDN